MGLGGARCFFGFAASATILCVWSAAEPTTKRRIHIPLKFAPLLVRLVRNGTLEDRAEEQETPRAVVQLLVGCAVVFQHVVYDLYAMGLPLVEEDMRRR